MVESLTGATVTRSGSVVSVTARLPRDELYYELVADSAGLADAGIQSVKRVGDYEGHRYARELDTDVDPDAVPFYRERYDLDSV